MLDSLSCGMVGCNVLYIFNNDLPDFSVVLLFVFIILLIIQTSCSFVFTENFDKEISDNSQPWLIEFCDQESGKDTLTTETYILYTERQTER